MSNEFANPNEELIRVAQEIDLFRRDLRQTLTALARIERRLKASFPNYPSKQKRETENVAGKPNSSLDAQSLQMIFNELVKLTQNDGDKGFIARIDQIKNNDLIALAVEIGVLSGSRTSRNKAIDGIRRRVQEAIQLQFIPKRNIASSLSETNISNHSPSQTIPSPSTTPREGDTGDGSPY